MKQLGSGFEATNFASQYWNNNGYAFAAISSKRCIAGDRFLFPRALSKIFGDYLIGFKYWVRQRVYKMVLMVWKDSYSVHVESIDKQHKKLISLINDLDESLTENRVKENVARVLAQLSEYTAVHFKHEEEIFERHKYQFEKEHVHQHDDLVRQVGEFKKRLIDNDEDVGEELLSFLLFWLGNHIKTIDRLYIPFMLEKGIK